MNHDNNNDRELQKFGLVAVTVILVALILAGAMVATAVVLT